MTEPTIEISIDDQQLHLLDQGEIVRSWPVSTALKGAGSQQDSHRTPVGQFAICEVIGTDQPARTQFKGRLPEGTWDGSESNEDMILSRILRLDGLDADNANTLERFIYIHGTNQESLLGTPVSCGCIRMANDDIIELSQHVSPGTSVRIDAPTQARENLIFFDCDSTLSSIEGIDELARSQGAEIFADVEALTNAAMNGEVPVEEVFGRRMEMIRPDQKLCDDVSQQYIDTVTQGAAELIHDLKQAGWTPVILSGGFAPLIQPLARQLGIDHVEAVPLHLDADGNYSGYGDTYPTTRNGGKPEVILEWKSALLPNRIIMVGDGNSDLESRSVCDTFVGYGGVVERETVKKNADHWITSFGQFPRELI